MNLVRFFYQVLSSDRPFDIGIIFFSFETLEGLVSDALGVYRS